MIIYPKVGDLLVYTGPRQQENVFIGIVISEKLGQYGIHWTNTSNGGMFYEKRSIGQLNSWYDRKFMTHYPQKKS